MRNLFISFKILLLSLGTFHPLSHNWFLWFLLCVHKKKFNLINLNIMMLLMMMMIVCRICKRVEMSSWMNLKNAKCLLIRIWSISPGQIEDICNHSHEIPKTLSISSEILIRNEHVARWLLAIHICLQHDLAYRILLLHSLFTLVFFLLLIHLTYF